MLTRALAIFALLGWLMAGALGLVCRGRGHSLALARQEAVGLRQERDQAWTAMTHQNQAIAKLEAEGAARAAAMDVAQRQDVPRIQAATTAAIQSLQAAAVPDSPELALRWGVDEARRLAARWEGGPR